MRVSVIGTGYVGLVSGACLADRGHNVVCVDVDEDKVDRINRGEPPIYEEGLENLLSKHVGRGLKATTDLRTAVVESDLTLLCVGTPSKEGEIDLTYIVTSARQVGEALRHKSAYHAVAVKSTVVPGTTDEVVLPILEESSMKRAGADFGVGMNPEFLTEGQAIADFMNPDRIVLGGIDERTRSALAEIYETFTATPLLHVNNRTAEMIKYTSNAMLATQISFANEIANLCSAMGGIDVVDVMEGVHLSYYLRPFVSKSATRVQAPIASFLAAGCGFGGSCLPKDVKALVAHGDKAGSSMKILQAVLDINASQPTRLLALVDKHHPHLEGVTVGVLGLAFKPDTDDMRESPAVPIIHGLLQRGAQVRAYDPVARESARAALGDLQVELVDTLPEVLDGASVLVLVTRWDEFGLLPELLKNRSPQPLVVDGRRMLDAQLFQRYEGIGRGAEPASSIGTTVSMGGAR